MRIAACLCIRGGGDGRAAIWPRSSGHSREVEFGAVLTVAVVLLGTGAVLLWLGLGAQINVRKALGAMIVIVVTAPVVMLDSPPAGATAVDKPTGGWTQVFNNDYPNSRPYPDCQPTNPGGGCAGFSDGLGAGIHHPDVNVVIGVGGAVTGGGTFDGDARASIYNY